jgi:hypothetical protein
VKTALPGAEGDLLLASIDASRTPEERDAGIRDLLGQKLDWNLLTRMTVTHRLVPMICPSLGLRPALVPFETFAGLRLCYLSNWSMAERCAGDLVKLFSEFKTAGVSAIALKGPTLSLMAYGDISTRQYFDLDVLVRASDVVTVAEVLNSAGYRGRTYDRDAFQIGFFRNTSDEFGTEGSPCLIDLRWKIADWYFPFGPDEDALWSRTETIRLKGYEVPTLGAADHLLFLCAHASKHGWPDLLSVADIAALLRARPGLDLHALIEEAERLHFKRMVVVGLLLAHRLARAPLPRDILGLIKEDPAANALGDRICERLLGRWEAPSELGRWIVALRTIERPRDRLRVLLSLGLLPTASDHASLRLPRSLYPLYYLVRPLRLAGRGAAMMARRASRRIAMGAATVDVQTADTLN